MLIYHTIYAYIYKKEIKHYKNDLEFSGFTKVSKMYFGLYKVKYQHIDFYSGNKCTNNLTSMFKTYV